MKNLLKETLEKLIESSKTPDEVRWVGSRDGAFAVDWATFTEMADFEYHNGFGGAEVADDLVVVGDGWWLERGEYDGSEWWEFKVLPQRQSEAKPFASVKNGDPWASV